ncbi:MAG: UDP-3-O-(3-hydroxymyristoyl)glucosamine N-acyltransferase [Candidatus Korobacteraceae bacterium]
MKSIELAQRIGALCEGGDVELTQVASFAAATSHSLIFVEHPRYLEPALASAAGAAIVSTDASLDGAAAAHNKVLLRCANPRLAFALAAAELRRSTPAVGAIHLTAVVHPTANIHPTARVDALAVVGAAAGIGPRTHLGPGCIVGPGVIIGADCDLVARVVIHSGTTLGDRVIVKPGAVLGGDGFGFVPDPATGRYHKFPQIGRLEIGNDVEIGANTCIDRGALDATVIADGVKLDNLVQVGHNVHIGLNVVVASQTGISGSSVLEDGVIVGGQVGIADHVRIEQGAILGAQCGIPSKKVLRGPGIVFWGTPARPISEYLRELATLARLTKKKK